MTCLQLLKGRGGLGFKQAHPPQSSGPLPSIALTPSGAGTGGLLPSSEDLGLPLLKASVSSPGLPVS